jgi:hypothetical protein
MLILARKQAAAATRATGAFRFRVLSCEVGSAGFQPAPPFSVRAGLATIGSSSVVAHTLEREESWPASSGGHDFSRAATYPTKDGL